MDELMNAKKMEEEHKAYGSTRNDFAQYQCGTTQAMGIVGQELRRQTMADEKAQNANYHRDQAMKAEMAWAFLRANPQFEEFISLVRSGAIQF